MRRFLPLFVIVLVVAIGIFAYRYFNAGSASGAGGPPGGEMPPTAVETAKVEQRALPNQYDTVGSLRADESAVIRPEVAGRIERIGFTEGQRVRAGTVLFQLDDALVRADLNEAQANLTNSQRANARASELASKQLISHADSDTAKSTFAVDQARAASARTRLDKSTIRAPFEGVVGLREVSAGDYVEAGQALVNLVRLDPMEVDFSVPEAQLGRLADGQVVNVQVDAYPGKTFSGKIVAIDPVIDTNGRSAKLRARIDNADLKLRPGLFARVALVYATNPKALMVPEQAIWPNGDQKMVFQVVDGKAKLVPVTLGERLPGAVEILTGLKAGDEVVTAGQLKLFDGAAVSPSNGNAAAASSAPAANQP